MANQTISGVARNFNNAAIAGLVNSDIILVRDGGTNYNYRVIIDGDGKTAEQSKSISLSLVAEADRVYQ